MRANDTFCGTHRRTHLLRLCSNVNADGKGGAAVWMEREMCAYVWLKMCGLDDDSGGDGDQHRRHTNKIQSTKMNTN